MATYRELKAQLAKLENEAAAVRQQEYDAVLTDIRAKVVEFGYTERDIFGSRRGRPRLSHAVSAAKYRDPASGATWSGRGRAPNWIRDARNRDRFLIRDGMTD
ncbi:H-NS histone family protein [Paraburkholderia mimosarum]|uniref:H-NS histone family protein n=1 Tax=Paraburkholderia mimosarum TaxID=312026 RepID=UPI0003F6D5B7|nr:H-NS histone family protein [Paraburkholderia mimosarum]